MDTHRICFVQETIEIKTNQITKYNRARNKRKHTFQSLSQCKNTRVNT